MEFSAKPIICFSFVPRIWDTSYRKDSLAIILSTLGFLDPWYLEIIGIPIF
jgi:hypothetical protein